MYTKKRMAHCPSDSFIEIRNAVLDVLSRMSAWLPRKSLRSVLMQRKSAVGTRFLNSFMSMYVDITLGSEFGKELKKQRSIQVEGAFGVIKEDMGFTRFRRRGMKGVTMEFLLVCLGYNLKKYHMYRLRQEKKNALKAC